MLNDELRVSVPVTPHEIVGRHASLSAAANLTGTGGPFMSSLRVILIEAFHCVLAALPRCVGEIARIASRDMPMTFCKT